MCGLLVSYVGVKIMDRQWRICTAYTLEYKLDLFLVDRSTRYSRVRSEKHLRSSKYLYF